MLRFSTAFLLILLLCLAACGPKEIGSDLTSDDDQKTGHQTSSDMLRYPVFGSATNSSVERRLYNLNTAEALSSAQNRTRALLHPTQNRGMLGINPESEQYRETPQQVSPFRQ